MNKLLIWMGSSFAALLAIALTAQGCAKPCNDLAAECGRCGDANYAAACRQTVNEGNEEVCQAQIGTFQQFCSGTAEGGGGAAPVGGCNGTTCAGACVDTQSDPAFCGSCIQSCSGATALCAGGVCTDMCPAALTLCGSGSCVDITTDPNHCGGCDQPCAAGQLCSLGGCVDACDAASQAPTECSGSCVSLANDPLNCGACDNACAPSEVCSAGQCATNCGNGQTSCCGKCVFTVSDPTHCGGCSPDCVTPNCSAGEVCNQGTCANGCGALTDCGGACVNTANNALHCGGCNVMCAPGQSCVGGACSSAGCPPGQTSCSGGCVNLENDPQNCGFCGTVCPGGQVCSIGLCTGACGDPGDGNPLTSCNGTCVDTTSDPDNCGTCGNACPSGQVCSQSACSDNCATGLTPCNGACVNVSSNFFNCGACGTSCNDQSVCTADSCGGGTCANASGALVCNDNNYCTQDTCDPIDGCPMVGVPLTYAQILALCVLPPGVDPQSHCIFCDPTTPGPLAQACSFAQRDDGIPCTDDACPMIPDESTPDRNDMVQAGVYTAGTINVNNNANCPTTCAPVCDKDNFPGALTDSNGCNTTVAPGACASRPCVQGCNPDSALADAVTGCVEDNSFCPRTCATQCSSDPAFTTVDSQGCEREDLICAGLEPCYDGCVGTPGAPNPNVNTTTGCLENNANCINGQFCEPSDPKANANGCCGALGFLCNVSGDCCTGLSCVANACL